MIGIIGLGNMGRPVAERLLDQDTALVVWNRSPGKAKGLDLAEAASPAQVVAQADVTLSLLADDHATEAVYFGEGGLVSADLTGKLVVEMCTMSPERAQTLAAAVEGQGGLFLECPVGGTVGPAREGMLLGLAGGSAAAFARAQPVLAKITRRLEHLGPVGTGAAMKLAINLPLMVYWSALGEALGIAQAQGVDTTRALDILADSSGAIGAAKKRVPPIREMVVNGDPGRVNLSVENSIKDMGLMVAAAQAGGSRSDVVRAARARAEAARDGGFAGLDASLVAAFGAKPD